MVLKKRRAMLVATSAALLGLKAQAQGADVCPRPLTGGGEVNTGQYSFAFKSWTWRNQEGAHVFCNCIRNSSTGRRTYLEWDGASLASFVDPDQAIYTYQSYHSDAHAAEDRAIYFGSGLTRVPVRTLLPRGTRVSAARSERNGVVRSPLIFTAAISTDGGTASDAADTATSSADKTRSRGQVLVPVQALPPYINDKVTMIEFIQSKGREFPLIPFEMTFESRAIRNGRGRVEAVAYRCTYASLPSTSMGGRSYGMRISDGDVHLALFERRDAVTIDAWSHQASNRSFNGILRSPSSDNPAIGEATGAMEIIALDPGLVVARLPIQFLRAQ